jgi:hypothetical protein
VGGDVVMELAGGVDPRSCPGQRGPNSVQPPACRLSRRLGEALFDLRFTVGASARRISYRFAADHHIALLTTFRKQRNNDRAKMAQARKVAQDCARENPDGGNNGQPFPLG